MPAFDHFAVIAPIYARVTYSKREIMREVASLPVHGTLLDVGGGTGEKRLFMRSSLYAVVLNHYPSLTIPLNASSWWTHFTT